jgi:hypothetical protein
MLIMKAIAGSATLAELYSMDFDNDVCIIGHSGAGDPAISSRRPVLRASEVFHGKTGKGSVTQFSPRRGPSTMLACTQDASGSYRLVVGEGEIVDGPILELGDTNCRIRFRAGLRDFRGRVELVGPHPVRRAGTGEPHRGDPKGSCRAGPPDRCRRRVAGRSAPPGALTSAGAAAPAAGTRETARRRARA